MRVSCIVLEGNIRAPCQGTGFVGLFVVGSRVFRFSEASFGLAARRRKRADLVGQISLRVQ